MALANVLKASRLFAGVDDATLEALARLATTRRFAEEEPLWHDGDPARAFTIIQRGLVRVVRRAPSGEEVILGLFGPRESVGDAAVIDHANYPATAVASSPAVEVIRLPADAVLASEATSPLLTRAFRKTLIDHTRALRAKIDVLSAGAVPARLAMLFLQLGERFGDEDHEGHVHVPIVLSRASIARLVSARVETVIRAMSRWQKADVLRTSQDGFEIVEPAKLREVLETGARAEPAPR